MSRRNSYSNPILKIFILRLLTAVPFAVFYSSLQLYLINNHFAYSISSNIVGIVLGLSFCLGLLGGYILDKLISNQLLLILSVILQALGMFTFFSHSPNHIYWLTSLFLLGCLGSTVCLNINLTNFYSSEDSERERSFFWFYLCLNIGYTVGYTISGYYANKNQYVILILTTILLSLCAITLILFKTTISKKQSLKKINLKLLLVLLGTIFLAKHAIEYATLANDFIILTWVIFFTFLLLKSQFNNKNKKQDHKIFFVLLFSALIFWTGYLLSPTLLIVFIKNSVNLKVFSFQIAPQWVTNANTATILFGTIILGNRLKIKKITHKNLIITFMSGLFFLALGFLIIAIAIKFCQEKGYINISWIVLCYSLQSIGELFIGPIGYAIVGRLAPPNQQNVMMGLWVSMIGTASCISGKLSASLGITSKIGLASYQHFFLHISLIIGIIIFTLYIFLARIKQQ